MKKKYQFMLTAVFAVGACFALAVLPERVKRSQRSTRTFLEKAYDVLDNPRWYENDPFLVQEAIDDKLPEGRPTYAPSAIAGREWSCIQGVLEEYVRNPEVAERLKKYAEHHNRKVAIRAVAGLVRSGDWSKEAALIFANNHGWTPIEIQEINATKEPVMKP